MADNVVVPIPPRAITKVPDEILEAFTFVSEAPEPGKVEADTLVADIVVPDKTPVNVPPV